MGFWIVMFILLAISAFLIYQCVAAAKNRRENRRRDDDYEQKNHERPRSRKSQAGQVQSARRGRDERDESEVDEEEEEYIPRRAGQKQWKILLENLDTWEKYTFMFYDEVGIGRAKDSPDFEQFLTIEGDPKVSKQHCTIIRSAVIKANVTTRPIAFSFLTSVMSVMLFLPAAFPLPSIAPNVKNTGTIKTPLRVYVDTTNIHP